MNGEQSLIDNDDRGQMDDRFESQVRSKRRKVSRDSDKKYACRHEGCSKKYGRVEHLYRHELNHEPKSIFRCMQPGCDRRFVRQDLLNRHVSRHENHESGQIRTSKARYDLAVTYRNEPSPGVSGSRKDSTVDPEQAFTQSSVKSEKVSSNMGAPSCGLVQAPASLSSIEQNPARSRHRPSVSSYDYTELSADSDGASAGTNTGMPVRVARLSPDTALRLESRKPEGTLDEKSFRSNNDFLDWLFRAEDVRNLRRGRSGVEYGPRDVVTKDDKVVRRAALTAGTTPSPKQRRLIPPRAFETRMSFARRRALVDYIVETFKKSHTPELQRRRDEILHGDLDKYPHVLSLPMLETYLSAFWESIHPQLSIVHRPTFAMETSSDLLLLCILALGATNIDRSHSAELRRKSSEFAFFVTWHVRHRLFTEPDFDPPAQLWVLQTLLMLEVLEKMFTSCQLHDRAQVHHGTTINLLRRSQSLGTNSSDTKPLYGGSPTATNDLGANMGSSDEDIEEEWYSWIAAEATRRIAFAAFVIDTTHAHMFGQVACMAAHELQIALPCDEAMWAAESMAEVETIRCRLAVKGYVTVGFHEALKKTLNNTPVKTNTLGRVSIMAGLLNVVWQTKVQGMRSTFSFNGLNTEWIQRLNHAYDFWKEDFDDSLEVLASFPPRDNRLAKRAPTATGPSRGQGLLTSYGELDRDNVFEARTVLYHLAHISANADLTDCLLSAGSARLLDRIEVPRDYSAAEDRLRAEWVCSPRAHGAVFFALRFLSTVLIPEPAYKVRDDVLLNRPWVLYLAALVLWAYVFALRGAESFNVLAPEDRVQRAKGTREYLNALNALVRGPEDVVAASDVIRGRGLVMMLLHLQDEFRSATWELLHDAAETLGGCVARLAPGMGL